MLKMLLSMSFVGISVLTFATDGSVEITGRANIERAPEFVELQVRVTSICYEKPIEAQEQNTVLTMKILEILKTYQRTVKDQLIATGGHTVRQTEFTSKDDGSSKVLCERKWRTTNNLILQTADMKSISLIQEKVLEAMLLEEGAEPTGLQQTYAELGEPTFSVFPETYSSMKKEAQAKAWKDASEQFRVFMEQCQLQNVKLSQISQPEYFSLAKSAPLTGSDSTPIIPEAISVFASWRFVWTFDPTACYR
jgi:uncharacterized protein YggE